jgi:hypothetical protein
MFKFIIAIAVGLLPCLAGLMYPAFYRNEGKMFILFSAFTAGAVLAAGTQNLSYSILYSWTDTEGEADMYSVAQHVMMQFAFFLFLRFWMSTAYKKLLDQMSPPGQEREMDETESLLCDSRENVLAPTAFDGSNDLPGACVIYLSLAYVPLLVGFSIGISPFSHTPTLVAYTLHRIAGAVSLSRSLDLRSTPAVNSWLSLISFSFAFPIGILLGSVFESDHANGFLVLQCVLTASILIYDVLAEHLPRIVKSGEMVFTSSGDLYVMAAFCGALIFFLILATQPPSFLHGENAKHFVDGGIAHRFSNNTTTGGVTNGANHNGNTNTNGSGGYNNGGTANNGNNNAGYNNGNNNNGGHANNNGGNTNYYPPNGSNNGGNTNNNGGNTNNNGGNTNNNGGNTNNNGNNANNNGNNANNNGNNANNNGSGGNNNGNNGGYNNGNNGGNANNNGGNTNYYPPNNGNNNNNGNINRMLDNNRFRRG